MPDTTLQGRASKSPSPKSQTEPSTPRRNYIVIPDSPPKETADLKPGVNWLSTRPRRTSNSSNEPLKGGQPNQTEPSLKPEAYQTDPRLFTQQPSDRWLEKLNEDAGDSIPVYSASDLESWRPLSPEIRASFEGWTDFSWSPPINLPSWASFLQSVRRPLEASAWHQCTGTHPPPSPRLRSRFQRPIFDIQEAEHEFQNGETAVSTAFREIEKSEKARLFEHPIHVSDEILYFQYGEDMPMCVSDLNTRGFEKEHDS